MAEIYPMLEHRFAMENEFLKFRLATIPGRLLCNSTPHPPTHPPHHRAPWLVSMKKLAPVSAMGYASTIIVFHVGYGQHWTGSGISNLSIRRDFIEWVFGRFANTYTRIKWGIVDAYSISNGSRYRFSIYRGDSKWELSRAGRYTATLEYGNSAAWQMVYRGAREWGLCRPQINFIFRYTATLATEHSAASRIPPVLRYSATLECGHFADDQIYFATKAPPSA